MVPVPGPWSAVSPELFGRGDSNVIIHDGSQIMTDEPKHDWRFRLGVALFVVGLLSPVLVPLVTASGLSMEWKTTLSGLLMLGIPELLWLVAAAVMGKSGFDYIKSKAFGVVKRYVLPETTGRARYRIGLVMFTVPLLFGWLAPYVQHLTAGVTTQNFGWNLGGDLLLLASLFVLGGEFWDKLRALFTYGASARFPEPA